MKVKNKSLLYILLFIILLFQSCAPQVVHTPPSGDDECQPPPPYVFTAAGVNLKSAQATFNKVVLGSIDFKTSPEVITLASKVAIDEHIRAYIRCLAINKEGFNHTQTAWLERLYTFARLNPTPELFIEWYKNDPFPDGKPKKTQSLEVEEGENVSVNLNTNDIDKDNLLKNGGFEQDLEYWGTGKYETNVYKGSLGKFWAAWVTYYSLHKTNVENIFIKKEMYVKVADVTGGIDSEISKSGKKSFKITMNQPVEGDMFGSMSQRITGLTKNAEYIARFWVKADRAGNGTFEITTDDEWKERKMIKEGSYPWQEFKHIFNVGDKTYIDFRIISEEPGTVWVDDISFKRDFSDEKNN